MPNPVRTMAIGHLKKTLITKVYDVAVETELKFASNPSARTGNRVYLKCEDDRPVFSSKLHGAYNKIASLTPAERKRGVITTSTGSYAQGVTFSMARIECEAVTCIPVTTPQLKIDSARSRDGDWVDVVLHGKSYSGAYNHIARLQEKYGYTFVHSFDGPEVTASQGTVAMETLRQHPQPIHAIFCSIGSGGLISDITAYVKAVQPDVKVIGAQSVDSDAMARSVVAGRRVGLREVGLFADGMAVKLADKEIFRLTRELVDEIIAVDMDVICAALKDVFRDTCSLLEPSGALALVGFKQYAETYKLKNESLVAVASGANMSFGRLRFVVECAEVGEVCEAVFAVTIPEERNSFKRFCELVGWSCNATELDYRIVSKDAMYILVGAQIVSRAEGGKIVENLRKCGFPTLDLSNDELAKQHIRYVVGGCSSLAKNEYPYRFESPERPGVLMKFLSSMSPNRNISLFHYRSQGADSSNILVGIQVPKNEKCESRVFLATLGYTYWDENGNPVYNLFL